MIHFHISYKLKECLKEIFWGIVHGMLIGAALALYFLSENWEW